MPVFDFRSSRGLLSGTDILISSHIDVDDARCSFLKFPATVAEDNLHRRQRVKATDEPGGMLFAAGVARPFSAGADLCSKYLQHDIRHIGSAPNGLGDSPCVASLTSFLIFRRRRVSPCGKASRSNPPESLPGFVSSEGIVSLSNVCLGSDDDSGLPSIHRGNGEFDEKTQRDRVASKRFFARPSIETLTICL